MLLAAKLDLFTIGTISIPECEVLTIVLIDAKTNTNAKIGTNAKIDIDAKIGINVEINMDPKISINTKIDTNMKISTNEPIFDFAHTLGKISVNITPARIKVQNMKMPKWNLVENVHISPLNLGTHDEPQVVKLNANSDPSIANAVEQLLKGIQICLCMDIQGSKKYSTSLNITSN